MGSLASWVANKLIWLQVFVVVWMLLPSADPGSTVFSIPDPLLGALTAVVKTNRYLPIAPLFVLATFEIGYRVVMVQAWLVAWVLGRINGR